MSDRRSEIIIIKRGGEDEEGHHGGAWKIAFADFMTAMMALFLVLWLINAANEETKRAVASYFNPVKLVDRNRSIKGIDESKGGPSEEEHKSAAGSQPIEPIESVEVVPVKTEFKPAEAADANSETAFFADPNAALDKISDAEHARMAAGVGGVTTSMDSNGDEFPDPFGPDFWNRPSAELKTTAANPADEEAEGTAAGGNPKVSPLAIGATADVVPKGAVPIEAAPIAVAEAETVRNEILQALRESGAAQPVEKAITVSSTPEGVLVSFADTADKAMFEVGSAIPTGPTVVAMEAVAKTLAAQNGQLRIYGHTDGRQFANGKDDNWRLSADRARSAYLMLLHGGISDNRIVQISGFADRQLKEPADVFAGVNRRIEVLIINP